MHPGIFLQELLVESIIYSPIQSAGAVQVIVRARAGGAGKLFGAVTSQEISDALKGQFGIEIEKNKIVQAEPIKTFGSFQVKAKLGYEVSGTINVLVVEG